MLLAVIAAAQEPAPSQPANASTLAGAAALQSFTEFLKAEAARAETATKHESEVIEHALQHQSDAIANALAFFQYVVGAAGAILVAGGALPRVGPDSREPRNKDRYREGGQSAAPGQSG
jgi:hypothetical protein